ncbi:eRF1 domain 1 domain-containing protein [Ditylenchus destructor]|nr:eRF1 domain 1 domain-containing protein [Ditylenchus destructor]
MPSLQRGNGESCSLNIAAIIAVRFLASFGRRKAKNSSGGRYRAMFDLPQSNDGKRHGFQEQVKLGAYHTLDLELNRPFTFEKPCWDTMDLHRLELCADLSEILSCFKKSRS